MTNKILVVNAHYQIVAICSTTAQADKIAHELDEKGIWCYITDEEHFFNKKK